MFCAFFGDRHAAHRIDCRGRHVRFCLAMASGAVVMQARSVVVLGHDSIPDFVLRLVLHLAIMVRSTPIFAMGM